MPNDMETRLAAIEKDQSEFRQAIREIRDIGARQADSLEMLVRLEERHIESREALGRAFIAIKEEQDERNKLADRVVVVETAIPPLQEARRWFVGGMLALIGVMLMAVVSLVMKPSSEPQQFIYQQAPPAIQHGGKLPAP